MAERIVGVATRFNECVFSKDGPAEHSDLRGMLSATGAGFNEGVDGFMVMDMSTHNRRFVSRIEAKRIAINSHQLADPVSDDTELISPYIFW